MLSSRLSLTSASLSWLSNFNTTSISKREGLLPAFFGFAGNGTILAQWIKRSVKMHGSENKPIRMKDSNFFEENRSFFDVIGQWIENNAFVHFSTIN